MKAEKNRLNHRWTQMRTDFIKLIPGNAALPLFLFTLALGKTVWNTN